MCTSHQSWCSSLWSEVSCELLRVRGEARLTGVHELPRRVQTTCDVDHGTVGADKLVEPFARRVIREVLETLVLRALIGLGAVDGRVADVLQAQRFRGGLPKTRKGTYEITGDHDLPSSANETSNSLVDHFVEVVLEDESFVVRLVRAVAARRKVR